MFNHYQTSTGHRANARNSRAHNFPQSETTRRRDDARLDDLTQATTVRHEFPPQTETGGLAAGGREPAESTRRTRSKRTVDERLFTVSGLPPTPTQAVHAGEEIACLARRLAGVPVRPYILAIQTTFGVHTARINSF